VVRGLACLAALALAACAAAPAREAGRAQPRLVSLNPCTDAILAEVADPEQLLAISSYSHDPASSSMDLAQARRFRATGGSVEEILSLKPDVVVGTGFMSPATVQALDGLGLRLERFGIAATVEDSKAQVRSLAALAGHPERGEALVARIDAALASAAAPAGAPVPAVIWQSGGIVAGADTLVSDVLGRTGFANMAAAEGLRQADHLPLEVMVARPPRVIFAAGAHEANEDRMLSHPALARLKDTRREPLDPALLWCGGPTIPRLAERLAKARRAQ
jgi:iron complex transport system substrate-binding protein